MKEIGGYFELEDLSGTEFHANLIALNTGRNALLYLCQAKNIRKVFLPYFLCDCVSNLCQNNNIEVSFYHIDKNFMPLFSQTLHQGEALYVVNFYGQLSCQALINLHKQHHQIIADNTHSFFEPAVPGIDTIYSCRKFFGVPDGAYLATNHELSKPLQTEKSAEKMRHLLGRYEGSASTYYSEYQINDQLFDHTPLRKMSRLAHNILKAVDYEKVAQKRRDNFSYLSQQLAKINSLSLYMPTVPFAYPLYCNNGMVIRKELAVNGIFVPTLWPNVLDLAHCPLEREYAANILPLPCDQRYDLEDMHIIVKALRKIGM